MNGFLLDTNVISDGTKPLPNAGLQRWLEHMPSQELYLSVITIGELVRGIHRLGKSKRAKELTLWLEQDLKPHLKAEFCRLLKRLLPVGGVSMPRLCRKDKLPP